MPNWKRSLGVALLGALLVVMGCKSGESRSASGSTSGVGQPLEPSVQAEDLRLSPDGKHVTYLVNGEKPRVDGIPPQMRLGELRSAPVDGGRVRTLGHGVTNVPGGSLFSPDGRWVLLLSGYNLGNMSGELLAADLSAPDADPVSLGKRVTYMLASDDGRLVAFVDGGTLKLGPLPAGPFREVGAEVGQARFTPDGSALIYKRRISAAGGLMVVPTAPGSTPVKLADQVGDYALSPDGKHLAFMVRSPATRDVYDLQLASFPELKVKPVAAGTTEFGFSADSRYLARLEGFEPGIKPDLVVGPADGSAGRMIAKKVEQFAFAPDASAIGMLENFDDASRAGIMSVAMLPDGEAKRLGGRVPNFQWSGDGKFVAFLQRFLKPLYSIDLMLYPVGAEAPHKVGQGVFGYGFTPDDKRLLFRTACIREGRACDLMSLDLSKSTDPATKILTGIYSFKASPDAKKLLVTYARMDSPTYDVAVHDLGTGKHKTLDQGARLPAMLVGEDGAKAVYILGNPKAGVFSASTAAP